MDQPSLIQVVPRPGAQHIYQGHSLYACGASGEVEPGGEQGFYHHDTRLISRWQLRIDGRPLRVVATSPVQPHSQLGYYLVPHLLQQIQGAEAEEQGVVVRVSRMVGDGMHEDVDIENHTGARVVCEVAWEFDADFADLTEARRGVRQQQGSVVQEWTPSGDGAGEVRFTYARPIHDRAVAIRFEGAGGVPAHRPGRVSYTVALEPREQRHFCVDICPFSDGQRLQPSHRCYEFRDGTGARPTRRLLDRVARIEAANPTVQAAWDHAVTDLASLALEDGPWPEAIVPAAGVPGYMELFGRDSLTTAWQAAMAEPVFMEASIHAASRYVGKRRDDFHDEEHGRIAHQVNLGPLATLGLTPFSRYYGDLAGPSDFLIVLGQYYAWTGDRATLERFSGTAERVLHWLETRADLDGDGFIEYQTHSKAGLRNQGWKDSSLAVVYEDGSSVAPPIAAAELQGYLYAAKQQYAVAIALGLRRMNEARRLLADARQLKRRFNQSFWLEEEGTVAFALDAQKRPVRSIVSNAGHCLATGIVDQDKAASVAHRLMAPDMFTGWGVRTLSSQHPSFNPMAYQLGSVWPVESATIAFGLKRYGFHHLANRVAKGLFDATELFPHHRLPEVLGGYQRDQQHPHPGVYPQAMMPQSWSASAVIMLVQVMLGLRPMAPLRLLFVDPALPEWLPEVTLSNLRVGSSRLTIRFRREESGRTGWKVLESHGPVRVVRQPPDLSTTAGMGTRATAFAGSFVPWAH